MNSKLLISLLLIGVVLLSGCIGTQQKTTQYVCPDGSTVSDSRYCPKSETTVKQTQTTRGDYCGDGVCQSGESCSSCSKDCGECKTTEKITYSDVNNRVSVSGFRYVPINCGGGTCRESSTGSAISTITSYSSISRSYSFKLMYSPVSNRPLYFQAYTPDVFNGFSTSNNFKLSPGENVVYMSSRTPNPYDDLNVKLCFSYIDFYITHYRNAPEFLKNEPGLNELDKSEYVCINKVFNKPNIDVSINPSTIRLYTTAEKNYDETTIGVTNTGNVPILFFFWAPNIHDGTGRSPYEPSCNWEGSDFILKPNENKEIKLTCGIYSDSPPSKYTDEGYVYALQSTDCGTQTMPLNKKGCPENAIFKKSFMLNFIVS